MPVRMLDLEGCVVDVELMRESVRGIRQKTIADRVGHNEMNRQSSFVVLSAQMCRW